MCMGLFWALPLLKHACVGWVLSRVHPLLSPYVYNTVYTQSGSRKWMDGWIWESRFYSWSARGSFQSFDLCVCVLWAGEVTSQRPLVSDTETFVKSLGSQSPPHIRPPVLNVTDRVYSCSCESEWVSHAGRLQDGADIKMMSWSYDECFLEKTATDVDPPPSPIKHHPCLFLQIWTQGGIHVFHERVPGDGVALHAALPLRDLQHGRRGERRRVRGLHRPGQRAVHAAQLTVGGDGAAQQGTNSTTSCWRDIETFNMVSVSSWTRKQAPTVFYPTDMLF